MYTCKYLLNLFIFNLNEKVFKIMYVLTYIKLDTLFKVIPQLNTRLQCVVSNPVQHFFLVFHNAYFAVAQGGELCKNTESFKC